MYRASVVEGEIFFNDLMLAWVRIIQKKYFLSKGGLLGCALNEVALESDFLFSAASRDDYYVKGVDIWVDYNSLPWPSASIEFLISTQFIEPNNNLSAIQEMYRVLSPGGYLLIFTFRKYSLIGLQKQFAKDKKIFPALYSGFQIRKHLTDFGLNIVSENTVSFRPILADNYEKYLYLEFLGSTIVPCFGSCELILAKKDYLENIIGGLAHETG